MKVYLLWSYSPPFTSTVEEVTKSSKRAEEWKKSSSGYRFTSEMKVTDDT